MEIVSDKTKVITNNPNDFQREIKTECMRLEAAQNFACDQPSLDVMMDQNPRLFQE